LILYPKIFLINKTIFIQISKISFSFFVTYKKFRFTIHLPGNPCNFQIFWIPPFSSDKRLSKDEILNISVLSLGLGSTSPRAPSLLTSFSHHSPSQSLTVFIFFHRIFQIHNISLVSFIFLLNPSDIIIPSDFTSPIYQ